MKRTFVTYPFKYGIKFVLALFFLLPSFAYGQDYLYVNTNNLILRDRPEKVYLVYAILHAACKLKVEPYDIGYKNDKAVKAKFYRVSISYKDDRGFGHYIGGWVDKRYVVSSKNKITVPGADKNLELNASEVPLRPRMGDEKISRDDMNMGFFPPPKYKGGEREPAAEQRIYRKGKKGGCYYISKKGRRVYVDKKLCNGK